MSVFADVVISKVNALIGVIRGVITDAVGIMVSAV